MPHIQLDESLPGIRSLAYYRPDTGKALYQLAQTLLRDSSPLSEDERELIAAYVSYKNSCVFCTSSHAAAARFLYKDEKQIVDFVLDDYKSSPISGKIKALLNIAGKVQADARLVNENDIQLARIEGANDRDIHDTVFIAAAFCMFNRYVDGLATITPTDPAEYEKMGERMGTVGYIPPLKN